MQLLKGNGVLVYDPFRPGMKNTDWWIVLNTDSEICRYYRWWVWRRYMVDLQNPSWGAHLSVLRGAKPRADKMHLWKKYQGEKIEFEYSPEVFRQNNETGPNHFWYIDAWSKRLNDIREELGFRTVFEGNREIRYHLTIGRTY